MRSIDAPIPEEAQCQVAVFDLGNVLIGWSPTTLYRKVFGTEPGAEARMQNFLSDLDVDAVNHRIDSGEDADQIIADAQLRLAGLHDSSLVAAYRDRWDEMLGPPIWEAVNLVEELRERGVKCFALSNWGPNFELAREIYPFLNNFDGHTISYRVGVIKPDPKIFHHLLAEFNLDPRRCLFIDDRSENLAAAKALGFNVHLFKNGLRLRAQLVRHGLLSEPAASGWERSEGTLRRSFSFPDFSRAWEFMGRVAQACEELDHHPDWSNSYNRVDISLTTHSMESTVTYLDLVAADEITRLSEAPAQP